MRKFVLASFAAILSCAPAWADDAAQILAANRLAASGDAWAGRHTLLVNYSYSGGGLTGTTASLDDLENGRFVDSYDTPPESGASGFDGAKAWQKDASGTTSYQEGGDAPELAVNEAYRAANLWWRPDFGGASIVGDGVKSDSGANYDVITVTPEHGKPFDAWFDATTHLLDRTVEMQGPQSVTTRFSDYRETDGVKLAGKLAIDDGSGEKYIQKETLLDAKFLPSQPASAYAIPKIAVRDYTLAKGTQTTVPFRLINNHIYAEVDVNGKGPYLFIFDTGGHDNFTPTGAKAVAAQVVGQQEGGGAGDAVVDEGETRVKTLEIGAATVSNQLFGVLDFDKPEVSGVNTDGMVGVQVFRRFVTRFDYGARTITLIDPRHFNPKGAGTPIHFVFDDHVPVVQGSFEGTPGMFFIDTGSRAELSLTKPFAESHNLRATHPKGFETVDGWGVGGPVHGFVTRGGALTIGPVTIDSVVTSFSTDKGGAFADPSYQGNIGSGILKRFIVTFDYPHQTMYLKPLPEPIADVGVFDRSGMWINQSDAGFQIVAVAADAPADQAGLKAGDEIVAVDGQTAKSIHLYDLRKRLRDDAPGTVVQFTVERSGKPENLAVTLRDLI